MSMKKFTSCLATLGLVTALFVETSFGSPVINQSPNGLNGLFADPAFPQIIADNFISTGGGLLNYELTFYGGYFPSDPLPTDAFTINLYSDAGGLPGGPANLIASGTADTRTATGNILFGVQEYEYALDLGNLNLAAGIHWIEISNSPGIQPNDVWFWETGDLDPINGIDDGAFSVDGGLTWASLGAGTNLAFRIETSAIPEPSSFALFGLALAGLWLSRRRPISTQRPRE